MGVKVRLLVPTVDAKQGSVVGLPEESAADLVANGKAVYVKGHEPDEDESKVKPKRG